MSAPLGVSIKNPPKSSYIATVASDGSTILTGSASAPKYTPEHTLSSVLEKEAERKLDELYVRKEAYDSMVDSVNKLISLIILNLPPTKQKRILDKLGVPYEF